MLSARQAWLAGCACGRPISRLTVMHVHQLQFRCRTLRILSAPAQKDSASLIPRRRRQGIATLPLRAGRAERRTGSGPVRRPPSRTRTTCDVVPHATGVRRIDLPRADFRSTLARRLDPARSGFAPSCRLRCALRQSRGPRGRLLTALTPDMGRPGLCAEQDALRFYRELRISSR